MIISQETFRTVGLKTFGAYARHLAQGSRLISERKKG
jgi:hypothetical protein